MSLDELTVRAAIILGLAILALIAGGWRKTARARTKLGRERDHRAPALSTEMPRRTPIAVEQAPVSSYHRSGLLRRLWALVASTGLAVVIGAVVATLIAFSLAFVVTVLTDLLKQ